LLFGPMRDDEERHTERIASSPVPGRFIRSAPPDDRTAAHDGSVEKLFVRAGRLAARLGRVAPGSAEDPVVQALASFPEAGGGPVVRPCDVPVQRNCDAS